PTRAIGVRPAVSAVIFDRRGRLLLQQRSDGGQWGLPGGSVEIGESVLDAVAREVHEETGLIVKARRLIGVYSAPALQLVRYRDTLGLPLIKEATIPDQHVRAALLGAGESEIELLEPLEPSSGIGRFLARRGEGLHHLCFDTPDIVKTLTSLKEMRVELLDEAPRPGLAGQIAFVHPRACGGVLVELATPSSATADDGPAPLRLKRLVIGASDVR